MMADADCNITYVNTSVTAMLQKNEVALRTLLPNFNVATLIGTNVDVFHKNPSHQRSLLQSLNQPYSTRLELGDLTFSLIASPLFDEKGKRLGTVVEWEDMSERLNAEKAAEDIANANQRTTSALDVCQANVMMADADYNIVYVNKAVTAMLANNEQQLRTALPQFNVANLIGTNIDTFHVNPAHQRGMLDNLKSTYKTNLELAGFTFGLIATPVFNDDNERIGTVVEWEDKTERLAAELEAAEIANVNARTSNALKVCQANVMMADADLNIVYVNDAVKGMLRNREKQLQALLPNFRVDKLIGTCVDDFHKDPAHQRGMLDKLRDVYKTDLNLGEMIFGLIATPVFNDDGERVGTVVEWEDKTERLAAEREAAEIANANSRTTSALDVCQANIMMADADYNIVYVNEAVVAMLSMNEQQLRTVLPKFDVASLIGTNIDTFHKNPAHQRGMLDKLTSTYQTDLELAGFTFGLIATPVFNDENERLGTVVEWEDKTERLARERAERAEAAENLRIKQALDNVSANAMIADAGNNIVFMNEAVQGMMRDAEADIRTDLPNFNSNSLIGQNVDVFHKNPAHQQNMLKSLASTYKTEIVVGGRTFSLIANPINSDDGERVGTVVEWNDRTAEVAIEKEIDGIIASAGRGELDARLEEGDKSGFFLNLTQGLNTLVEIVDDAVAETGSMLDAMAHGDLTKRIDKDYEGSFDKLKRDANTTAEKLTEVIDQINTSATLVASGAEEISQGNADLSQRTEEQASSLEETASSMEEMTSTVRQNADNAKVANELAANTQDQASQGGQVVQRAVTSMAEINDSSKKISDIIGVIDEIAFQTNLLALNAAVEAARAGEQGRGFAVVAGEVRNLAQRSAAAAKEIKELIRDSVSKVEDGTLLVNESGTTLQKIVLSVQKVTEMIADITVASEEQSSGIEQVNKAITQMDEMTQQNAALVEEASAAGESMAEQANGMRQLLTFFKSNAGGHNAALPAPTSHKPAAPKASRAQRLASPSTGDDFVDSADEWEEF
nr:methyl-accepting chemotaxis protein [Pseudoalteromonas sp. C2R02]